MITNEEIKVVLTELLEEQKQETLANGEMIALLKKMTEKMELITQQKSPSQTIIKHHHHVRSSAIITIAFAITIVILTWLYVNKQAPDNLMKAGEKKKSSAAKQDPAPIKKIKKKTGKHKVEG